MTKMKFLNYYNSEYIFIFDYYDIPLFYISKNEINNTYYLLYFLDYNYYFFKELNKKEIELIFSGLDIRNILKSFYDKQNLEVIHFKEDDLETFSVDDYLAENNFSFEELLPDENEYIEFDMQNKMNYEEMKENYQQFFPEFFNIRDLTLRLIDENNSNNLPVETVLESINYIKKIFNDFKNKMIEENRLPGSHLKIAAFTPGSFKIEFKVEDDTQMNLFGDTINFDEMVDFINNLQSNMGEVASKEEIILNKSLITATNEFYEVLEDEKLKVEFFNNDKIVANLTKNSKIDDNLSSMYNILKEEEKSVVVHEEILNVSGEVLSANKSRNNFKISAPTYGDISGIFEKQLFKKIKNSEEQITVSKNITAKIRKVVESQPEKTKYIMESFTQ